MQKRKVEKIFSSVYELFHRPSPLQREIMQEEKEIKELERQKADMEQLDQLRERKKRLFKEVEEPTLKRHNWREYPSLEVEAGYKEYLAIIYADGLIETERYMVMAKSQEHALEKAKDYYPSAEHFKISEVTL